MAEMASVMTNLLSTNTGPAIQAIICSLCNKSFVSKSSLKGHIANVHDKKKNHKCLKCGKLFFKMSNLRDHIDIH